VACGCVNSRIFFSECGSLPRPARGLLRRGLAAPCCGRGNPPPKAVSEPPASAKCKPFHFVSGHSTRSTKLSFCAQIFIGTRCFPCSTALISIKDPPTKNLRQLLISSRRIGIVLFAVSSALQNGKKIQSSSVCNYGCQL
jgi:hypothetical protein